MQQLSQSDAAEAVQYARQLLQHNPLLEEAHGQLIWLYASTGQRHAALQQYEQCRALLQAELGIEPTHELQALKAAIATGQLARRPHQAPAILPTTTLPTPDLVGRANEYARLQAAWSRAQTGQGNAIVIGATAGSGKSRLVAEMARHLPETAVFIGHCYESTRTLPYQPWTDILETHLQRLDETALQQLPLTTLVYVSRLLPGLTRWLPASTPATPGITDEPERLFTAVVDFLAHPPSLNHNPISDQGLPLANVPRLFFLDDLQWADEASLRLLHYFSQRVARFPWLLIGAYRTEETAEAPALTMLLDDFTRRDIPRLALSPLSATDIEELAVHIWPQIAPGYRRHIAAMLAQTTGGNALFVTAVLHELAAADHTPVELPVPATVQDLIQRRLRRLPQGSRQVLEALAVLGSSASLAQLQQMSARSDEELAQALEWGLQWDLLTEETALSPATYQFHHDLLREAVYATLSTVRRQRLHRRAAQWLARLAQRHPETGQQEMAPRILYHARRGEAFDQIFVWAPLAAGHAGELFAYRDALHALDMMRDAFSQLQFLPDFDLDTAEPVLFEQLLWWLAHSWMLGKSSDEEQAVLQQAQALLARHPSPLRAAKLQFVTAQIMLPFEEAIPVMQEVYRKFWQLGELPLAAKALSVAASSSITISRNRNGRSLYEQALALYRQAHDVAGEIHCLTGLAWTAVNLGEIALALRHSQEALTISQEWGDKLGQAQALYSLAAAWTFYHAPEKMAAPAAEAQALYSQMGFHRRAIRPYLTLGAVADARGNWHEALAMYEDALKQATTFEDSWVAGWAAQLAGRIYLHEGQLDMAAARLQQAQLRRLKSGERQNQVSDLAWLGRLALAQGDKAAALQYTAQAVYLLDTFRGEFYVWEQPDVLMCRAEALTAASEEKAAMEIASRALKTLHQFAQQIGNPEVLAQFMAYPLNARVETAAARQQISFWPDR